MTYNPYEEVSTYEIEPDECIKKGTKRLILDKNRPPLLYKKKREPGVQPTARFKRSGSDTEVFCNIEPNHKFKYEKTDDIDIKESSTSTKYMIINERNQKYERYIDAYIDICNESLLKEASSEDESEELDMVPRLPVRLILKRKRDV